MKKQNFLPLLILSFMTLVSPLRQNQAPVKVHASNSFNVTYETYGGTNDPNNPSSYTDTQADVTLLPASKAGLEFQGWYKTEAFTEFDKVEALPGNHAGVIRLYAKWGVEVTPITIDFVTNGGTPIAQQTAIPIVQFSAPTIQTSPTITTDTIRKTVSRDINNDGLADYIGFNNSIRHIYLSNGSGGFDYSLVNSNITMSFIWDAKFIDINNDGLEDLVAMDLNGVFTFRLRQSANGPLGTETRFSLQSGGSSSNIKQFEMVDLNDDGLLDVVIAGNALTYRLNLGNNTFGPALTIHPSLSGLHQVVRVFDFNQDGHLDVFAAVPNTGSTSIVKFGDGITPFGGQLVTVGLNIWRAFVSDVDQDGLYEIFGFETSVATPKLIKFNAGSTVVNAPVNFTQFPTTYRSYAGTEIDYNGDGRNDIAFYQLNGSGLSLSTGSNTYFHAGVTVTGLDFTIDGASMFNPSNGTIGLMGSALSSDTTPPNKTQHFLSRHDLQSITHLFGSISTTKPGYAFAGWYEDPNFNGPQFNLIGNISGANRTLYAKWTLANYTVTYNLDGGVNEGNNPTSFTMNSDLPLFEPSKPGFRFAGWYTDANFTGSPITSIALGTNNNLNLFAKWDAPVELTFDSNGGSSIASISDFSDEAITLPTAPTRSGYTFAGWFTDQALTTAFTATAMPANAITLYAKWTLNTHQLTINVDGTETTQTVNFGTSIQGLLPTSTIKSGHAFVGWSINNSIVSNLADLTMPDNPLTITAIFRDNVPPVVQNINDGDIFTNDVEIIFNEGTAQLNGEAIISGHMVTLAGDYELVVTDTAGNATTLSFTIATNSIFNLTNLLIGGGLMLIALILLLLLLKKKRTNQEPVSNLTIASFSQDIDQTLSQTPIFIKPLVLKDDLYSALTTPSKEKFSQVFVIEKRQIIVPELSYQPNVINHHFFQELFRYIYRFAKVLDAKLLEELTHLLLNQTQEEVEKLRIVEASTYTFGAMNDAGNNNYLLKLLRRNVALHRDVINPRNTFVYAYQKLATLLEEMGIYLEAVILVREAYERNLVDTPENTFEKRLTRLENLMRKTGGKRQDLLR